MTKNNILIFFIVFLSLTIGFLFGTQQNLFPDFSVKSNKSIDKLSRLIEYIENDYVDTVNTDSLVGAVIKNIVSQLDPHSAYIPKENQQLIAESMQGNFVGIGVSFQMIGDTIAVIRVLEGGPSEKIGLVTGDRILTVDQDTLYQKGLTSQEVIGKLKGQSKSPINLKVYRKSNDSIHTFNFTRGPVPLPSVTSHYMLNNTTGYLKINRFSKTTFEEFHSALQSLVLQDIKNCIVDLRGNPGGYLFAATQIADSFLSVGKSIVIVQSNKGEKQATYSSANGLFEEGKLYILVDEQSASASEVIAGALQDNDRGWIIGRRTFGKGLVQRQVPLGMGDELRLTTARYYTPTGRSIQRPYSNNNKEEYYAEVQNRYESGEMLNKNNVPVVDSLAFTTPKGRIVYGGGGIVPDFYISDNISSEERWNGFVLRSNFVNRFVFSELDKNRGFYNSLTKAFFYNEFVVEPDYFIPAFIRYCEVNNYPFDMNEQDKIQLLLSIKAYIAFQLFDESLFIQILNHQDRFITAALEHIES